MYVPLRIARLLERDYRQLLRTTFRPRREELRQKFEEALNEEGFLVRDVYLQNLPSYEFSEPLGELHPETRRMFGPIAERPYRHQAEAARHVLRGKPVILATGTGSGKTEAFLMPIVDWCVRYRNQRGVKAILLYPMNALANNQRDRLRQLLQGTGITFGRYTGETELSGQRPSDAPEEECCTRVEFWQNPPNILLTNYQMLDYMLIRGDGERIFRNHSVRFIVLDEVHTYHGKLGTDVAFLLRRLRSMLRKLNPQAPEPLFIGTSATLEAGELEEDPKAAIAEFFRKLTGQGIESDGVITEPPIRPVPIPEGLSVPKSTLTNEDLERFDPKASKTVHTLAQRLVGAGNDSGMSVAALYERTPLAYLLVDWLRKPESFQRLVERWAEYKGTSADDTASREVEAALLIGCCLPGDHPLRLRLRAHRLLRGLLPFWRCMNPECGRLLRNGETECPDCGARALPLLLCRTCGWDFYAAYETDDAPKRLLPWTRSRSDEATVFLYEPPKQAPEVDAEEEIVEEEAFSATETEPTQAVCPQCLAWTSDGICPSGCDAPPRPVLAYRRRGTICPICGSRYGRFDVLTPVSMGVSRALTEVTRSLLNHLPAEQKKVLVFCDSRQDAAHQTWFMQRTEDRLWFRRAVYAALSGEREAHDWEWVRQGVLQKYIEWGREEEPRTRDARERALRRVEGQMLMEFSLQANVRASLERLGLVRVRYAGLDEAMASPDFQTLCRSLQIPLDRVRRVVPHILDLMRTRRALAHPALQQRLYSGHILALEFDLPVMWGIGKPVAFLWPEQTLPQRPEGCDLIATWRQDGRPAFIQILWRHFLGSAATAVSLRQILEWLLQRGYITEAPLRVNQETYQGLQVDRRILEFEPARSWVQCEVCSRTIANGEENTPCPRVDGGRGRACEGTLRKVTTPFHEEDQRILTILTTEAPPILSAEHTSAIPAEERQSIEQNFQAQPPRVNVIVCTPTLELGIDIGDLESVALRNIPPNPAHYAQRAGRTGRQSRMGVVAGFSRARPHDGYFFDHPDEIIAGAIRPPRFYSGNMVALACHVRSLVLEEADISYGTNLEPYIGEEGQLNTTEVENLIRKVRDAIPAGLRRAETVFGDLPGVTPQWLQEQVNGFPEKIRETLERRARAIESAVEQMRHYTSKVRPTPQERQLGEGYRQLAQRLRSDPNYAYLPRVLAEAGLIPGYAFPPDTGALYLGLDPEPVLASRLQAQREFAPGQVVYMRGHRWEVQGIALHRPGGITEQGIVSFAYVLCSNCGLANRSSMNQCARCRAELGGATEIAWDVAAFRAEARNVEPEMEDDRRLGSYDVRPHPQQDVSAEVYHLGECTLEYRHQEEVWWINRGRIEYVPDGSVADVKPFVLCEKCGKMTELPVNRSNRGNQRRRLARHSQDCDGVPQEVSLGHQVRADTLRLIVPGIESLGSNGTRWAWSLVHAMIQGAVHAFQIDEDDLDGWVLVRRDGEEQVLEILWVDTVVGGSGVLREMAERFPKVAQAALRHLEGHDCAGSCYRCLRTYRNQRVHPLLDWRLVIPWLKQAASETMVHSGSQRPAFSMEGPEWDEARREGCQSPAELRLLGAIQIAGLPEPEKQYPVEDERGQTVTIADFAYPDCRLLIYVDGLAFHSSLRQRLHDYRIDRWLQRHDFFVLRFLASEVYKHPERCTREIRTALQRNSTEIEQG